MATQGDQHEAALRHKSTLSLLPAQMQSGSVLIAACPRYYQGPKLKRGDWKQLALPLDYPPHRVA
jgi:hypothetical protein